MTEANIHHARIDSLTRIYGDGQDGSAPTPAQWRQLLERPPEAATSLVNLFKLREEALYTGSDSEPAEPGSGQDAFARYSAVSMPALGRVGGRFTLVGPFASGLVGDDEDWDLVAIGAYPSGDAVLALFEDAAYQSAYAHRRAACLRQRVFVVG